MLPGKSYSPEEVVSLLVRRAWLLLLPLCLGLGAGAVYAGKMSEEYRSETLIMVVPQRIPDSYVKRTDTTTIGDRLASITEQIQSRSRLERIISEFDLYPDERARGVMEDVVQRMRSKIGVQIEGQAQEAFRVSYTGAEPRTAQKVTERLASWYIEENLRDRANLASSTHQFLEAELEDAKRRLLDHEKKLEDYRRRFSGQLPSQLDSNLQSMQNVQLQLQSINESINRGRERRLLIERQLADAELVPVAMTLLERTAPGEDQAPASAAQQLEVAKGTLDRLRLRFTADHPDVRSLERAIAELEVKAKEESLRPVVPAAPTAQSRAEVARQKRIRDFQAEIDTIDRQIASNHEEQERLKTAMLTYQSRVDAVPSRESELVELTRDYGTLQASYASLLTKREDAKLASNLDQRQIGAQFKVLDPASLPERPTQPLARVQVIAGSAAAGLAVGLLIVAFLEYRDSSFKTEQDVIRVLSLPVLALVPVMAPMPTPRRRRGWPGLFFGKTRS